MKLAVFGLTLSSSWGNGHATLWRGLCRARREAAGSGVAMVTSYCPDGIAATSLVFDAAASGGPLAVPYDLRHPGHPVPDPRRPAGLLNRARGPRRLRLGDGEEGFPNVEPQREKVRV